MMFAVVAYVPQQGVEWMTSMRQLGYTMEFDVVGLGTAVDYDAREQVSANVNDRRKLGITVLVMALNTLTTSAVVAGNMTRFQSGGIDGRQFARIADYATASGKGNGGVQQSLGSPLFSSRSSA